MSIERLGYYAFYGTLRRGMENHQAFALTLTYLDTVVLPGYRMHALTDYPYVTLTNDPLDSIVVELFRTESSETEEMIYDMEIDAGYILSSVAIDGDKFGIYIFPSVRAGDAYLPDGDWVKYALGRSF